MPNFTLQYGPTRIERLRTAFGMTPEEPLEPKLRWAVRKQMLQSELDLKQVAAGERHQVEMQLAATEAEAELESDEGEDK